MPNRAARASRRQCAALPLARQGEAWRVLLVTSRETRRWVIPKGWVGKRNAAGQAAQEAYEEAGIRGRIATTPIGRYAYAKRLPDGGSVTCTVEVFPLQVETLLEDWPEKAERERRWFDLAEAAAAVREDGLSRLMLSLAALPAN
ncbi:NUDIX hydrolase [Roseicella frigidaeris]|uniref:NUDIX hydrolase n=1 Tax=Roseicella frigidaeris TaxID=2230885 RepID=A0A327M7P3_9PROT|nr:NUDIX hydrolase [Roseicella frigidaeris]RAI58495.1 NUDIX hydrolase [Roseicella frigidaeris]